ncbi:MAG TPA: phosphotransferase [Candidatus Sulfotelmatobacter sp.]|nr:phosphotransferase [Candidatus Sulfotelmatobacter sp.]
MRSRPLDIEDGQITGALAERWGLEIRTITYAPVGGGSHHWKAVARDGTRHFVTVDDLDDKPWFGSARDHVFAKLEQCYGVAATLREAAGLEFVVAPVADRSRALVTRLSSRYTIGLFPFVEGAPVGSFDLPPRDRPAAVRMFARLHGATRHVEAIAPRRSLELPGRADLAAALADLDRPWTGGVIAERARRWISDHAAPLARALEIYDALALEVDRPERAVITHGEPHGGNMVRTAGGLRLVDWDTVALAQPERDLWNLGEDPGQAHRLYARISGRTLDQNALRFYSLAWQLADVAAFTKRLRTARRRSADVDRAWKVLSTMRIEALE